MSPTKRGQVPVIQNAESRRAKALKIVDLLSEFRQDLGSAACMEIGCHAGMMTEALAPFFGSVTGLDIDRAAVFSASAVSRRTCRFLVADGLSLPFPQNTFDVVLVAQVYEHVRNTRALMQQVSEVLRPGGLCFFSGPNWLWPIEDHYGLPFVHWLPRSVADRYLQLTGKGLRYEEGPQTAWSLRNAMGAFEVHDVSARVLSRSDRYFTADEKPLFRLPSPLAILAAPIVPNFNWILRKRP